MKGYCKVCGEFYEVMPVMDNPWLELQGAEADYEDFILEPHIPSPLPEKGEGRSFCYGSGTNPTKLKE